MCVKYIIIFIPFALSLDYICNSTEECSLHSELENKRQCSPMVRPVHDFKSPIAVNLNLILVSINSIDEISETFRATIWMEVSWTDCFMKWSSEQYKEIDSVIFPLVKVWAPDLCFLNEVVSDKCVRVTDEERVVVQSNGTTTWYINRQVNTQCDINIDHYPFDLQNCSISIAKWYSTDEKVQLKHNGLHAYLGDYKQSGEWDLINADVGSRRLNDTNNFTIIDFRFLVRRRPLFYVYYVILPVVALSVLNVFCFILPIESGEKIGFSVAVFLTFAVFLSIISSSVPKLSDHKFCLGIYMTIELIIGAITIGMEVIVTHLYHRSPEQHLGLPWTILVPAHSYCSDSGSDDDTDPETSTQNPWHLLAKRMDMLFGSVIALVNILSFVVYFVVVYNF